MIVVLLYTTREDAWIARNCAYADRYCNSRPMRRTKCRVTHRAVCRIQALWVNVRTRAVYISLTVHDVACLA